MSLASGCESVNDMEHQNLPYHDEIMNERFLDHKRKMDNLVTYLTTRKCPPGLKDNEARNVKNQAKHYRWSRKKNELLYVQDKPKRVITRVEDAIEILHMYHGHPIMGAHSGINTTRTKISQFYTWNNVKQDIDIYIKKCTGCPRAQALKSVQAKEVMEVVQMDLIGPLPTTDAGLYRYVLAFTDFYSKFVDFFPLTDKAATGVAKSVKTYVCRWGAPQRLLSDLGREFVAQVNAEVCAQFAMKMSVTVEGHPPPSDLDEATKQTIRTHLLQLISDHRTDWDRYLDEAAYRIRTLPQADTMITPYVLMFGRHPRAKVEEAQPEVESQPENDTPDGGLPAPL